MQSWVPGILVTIPVSAVSAWGFLLLRCRRAGRPFGPKAKWWAVVAVAITAIVSTGLAWAAVTVSHHILAVYVGLIVPSVLWLEQVAAQRRVRHGSVLPGRLIACLLFPLRRLDDGMGQDMQDWCQIRLAVASEEPDWLADAAKYYYNQARKNRIKNQQLVEGLGKQVEWIVHKISIVNRIRHGTSKHEVYATLQAHPSTRGVSGYTIDDLDLLASRLVSDAQNELYLLLAFLYRLGFRKMLIYPLRPQGQGRSVQ